jgi:hypothetical protein
VGGAFDELSAFEAGAGADECDEPLLVLWIASIASWQLRPGRNP